MQKIKAKYSALKGNEGAVFQFAMMITKGQASIESVPNKILKMVTRSKKRKRAINDLYRGNGFCFDEETEDEDTDIFTHAPPKKKSHFALSDYDDSDLEDLEKEIARRR